MKAVSIVSKVIMEKQEMDRALMRIAHEIIERNEGAHDLLLIGIQRRGVPLAECIADNIGHIEGKMPPVGILDITLYRDDLSTLSEYPLLKSTDIPFAVAGMRIVLVDDVVYTGRTARAAIDAVIDFGRPKCIQLAALIDRGHRELPIRADFVGKNIPTAGDEVVRVHIKTIDGEENVCIEKLGTEKLKIDNSETAESVSEKKRY